MNFLRNAVRVASIIAVGAFALGNAHADVITGWDFSTLTGGVGNWGPSPLTATTTSPSAVSGGLVRGSGILTPVGSSAAARAYGGSDYLSTDAASAILANDFLSFTVTPSATLSLSDIGAYNIRHSASGPSTALWQYQVGAGSFVDIGTSFGTGAVTTVAGNPQASIDLSGISSLQNVSSGTPVTFRLVMWGGTTTGGTGYLNDPVAGNTALDLVLNGTFAAVPEPGSLALLGLAALPGVAMLRRRRAAK